MKKLNYLGGIVSVAAMLLPTFASAEMLGTKLDSSLKLRGPDVHIQAQANASTSVKAPKPHTRSVVGSVTAVNGNTVTLKAENGTVYTVDTNGAKLYRKFWQAMTVSEIQVNDKLVVFGVLDGTNVDATWISNHSLWTRADNFKGTVSATTSGGFTLDLGKGKSQAVNVVSTTVFKVNGVLSDIKTVAVGAAVKVYGTWERVSGTVTAKIVNVIIKTKSVTVNGTVVAMSSTTLSVKAADGTVSTVLIADAQINSIGILSVGDTVRVEGKQTDGSAEIKASVVKEIKL